MQQQNSKTFYDINPREFYLGTIILLLIAFALHLSGDDPFQPYLFAILAISIPIIAPMGQVRYVITSDGLEIKAGRLAAIRINHESVFINREDLFGIGSIAPIYQDITGLYFRGNDGKYRVIRLLWRQQKKELFTAAFTGEFPDKILTGEMRKHLMDELFGAEVKDVHLTSRPWIHFLVFALLLLAMMILSAFTIYGVVMNSNYLTISQADEGLTQAPSIVMVSCVALTFIPLLVIIAMLSAVLVRVYANDHVYTIYERGIKYLPPKIHGMFTFMARIPPIFIKWEDIVSIQRLRIYPITLIRHKAYRVLTWTALITGTLDPQDFEETLDMWRRHSATFM